MPTSPVSERRLAFKLGRGVTAAIGVFHRTGFLVACVLGKPDPASRTRQSECSHELDSQAL